MLRGFWGAEFGTSASDLNGALDGRGGQCLAAAARSGAMGYRCTTGSTGEKLRVDLGGKPVAVGTKISHRWYIRIPAYPTEDTEIFSNSVRTVYLRPDGRVHFGGFPTLSPINDIPYIPLNTWVRLEIAWSYSLAASPGTDLFEFRVNGTSVYRRCGVQVLGSEAEGHDDWRVGWPAGGEAGLSMDIDDCATFEGVWGGPGLVYRFQVIDCDLPDGWVPGMWENVDNDIGIDEPGPGPPGCNCGGVDLTGVRYEITPDTMVIPGLNAVPPVGKISNTGSVGGGEGTIPRDTDMDKMASNPGMSRHQHWMAWRNWTCIPTCPLGTGYIMWYAWDYHLRTISGTAMTSHIDTSAPGSLRGANWCLLAGTGATFPVGGSDAHKKFRIRLPALEPGTGMTHDFDALGLEGAGDWPRGWSSFVGPMHQNPSAGDLAELECYRMPYPPGGLDDPDRVSVCILTAAAEISEEEYEPIAPCKVRVMAWV